MKALSNEDKLQVMNRVIEPFINKLSPDVVASCITSMLKGYLNSPAINNDEVEIRASVVLSAGLTMDMLNQLMIWYED